MAIIFLALVVLACTVHCMPQSDPGVVLQKTSEATANAGQHEARLSTTFVKEMEGFEDEINKVMQSIWPLLNFIFNPGPVDSSDNDCVDDMIIQLMPEDAPAAEEAAAPQDVSENSATASSS